MAQHDFNIANQSFPSFRTDLNNALSAINTSQSGTSRPSGAVAGTIWLDTTSATTPTLKYYDGADDISLATLDHSANTVNWLDSTVSVTGLTTTATGTVLTLSDSSLTSSVNLILQNQKEIRFSETTANGTNYVGFKAPASLSADKIWVLPSADGTAGQFLKTDGAGNLSFDSLSFSTPLAVIGNATSGSEIRLPEDTDNGSNYVALKAPDTITSNLTLTLPSADGTSGQVLQTNGSGVLSFISGGGSRKLLTSGESNNVTSLSISSTYLTSSYNVFEIFISHAPRASAAALELFVSTNNGTNYHNVDRVYHYFQIYPSSSTGTGIAGGGINTDRANLQVSLINGDFANSYIQIIRPKFSGGTGTHRNRNTITSTTTTCQSVGSSVNIERVDLITCISNSDSTNRNNDINNIKFEGNGASMDYKYAVYGIAY
jgi:hypothetical protein